MIQLEDAPRAAAESNLIPEPSPTQKRFLAALGVPNYAASRQRVEEPASGALTWFLNESAFMSWIEQKGCTLLTVYGSPGQGKSVISKFLLNHLESTISEGHHCSLLLLLQSGRNPSLHQLPAAITDRPAHPWLWPEPAQLITSRP